ncbi:hypothetical protein [Winogradskyella sp. PG-2]|uniref:hypothetical protein n=1 Tax=Winogradskyella sp. PG-2 TaxID=754409 RepID=UPI0004586CF6|nr:hypothetical protein [Winogradskyella sp. PG-2]BAO77068.1 hypothetical protein WPG_2838 [Winogradskyella sp. PG-2]
MSTFLTGKALESKLTDIIWNAKKYVVIVSPFIKLDEHTKEILEKIKNTPKIALYIVFGENEDYKYNSFNENDLEYFKDFKNITILYNKDLHAKHYSNENEGLITSLNLYGYSMIHNVEYGVYFSKTILYPLDKLFEETYNFTHQLIHESSEVVYIKRPQYSKSLFGLKKERVGSNIIFDICDDFFDNCGHYEKRYFSEFDMETETIIEKKYGKKPEREKAETFQNPKKVGYCIRTREEILFNPQQPLSKEAWKVWNRYGDIYFPEKYCHETGKASNGKTSMANPILT